MLITVVVGFFEHALHVLAQKSLYGMSPMYDISKHCETGLELQMNGSLSTHNMFAVVEVEVIAVVLLHTLHNLAQ